MTRVSIREHICRMSGARVCRVCMYNQMISQIMHCYTRSRVMSYVWLCHAYGQCYVVCLALPRVNIQHAQGNVVCLTLPVFACLIICDIHAAM